MLDRLERGLRALRRGLSRAEWGARLLGLPRADGGEAQGLVMIQVDGLAHRELEHALARGDMPFLARLLTREHYRLHPVYAGVPATTAAFQAELFHGLPGAVAGFGYREHDSGHVVRLYEPSAVARQERALEEHGQAPLLEGGSAYVDIFVGGAAESHFCPTARGWGPALREAGRPALPLLVLAHVGSGLRVAGLLAVETVLAGVDCVRGVFAGHDLGKELEAVPTRVAVSILLRELATIGARIDVARGLPVVHLNLLGYDEQAHRRGPASLFARWTLKGIDAAIARVWHAAHRSQRAHYDVWIHSDHGQEQVRPWSRANGRDFAAMAGEVFARRLGEPVVYRTAGTWGEQLHRVSLLGGRRVERLFRLPGLGGRGEEAPQLTVVTLGPIAHLYWEGGLDPARRAELARDLLLEAHLPAVLAADGLDRARAWTADGELELPRDAARLLGPAHPHRERAARDLVRLCHHPDSGQLLVSGWRAGEEQAWSFATEHGAHGGAGPVETTAFALLPADAPLPECGEAPLRALDLRQAALATLGRADTTRPAGPDPAGRTSLRIMSYNVHSCIGTDGRLSPERIARVIARHAPDVVALQELDVGRSRSGGIDQAHRIATILEMDFHFHPAIHTELERYGDAVLTHLPVRLVKTGILPGNNGRNEEPRGAIWVEIEADGHRLQLINTHLGLLPGQRRVQVEALLGPDWLGHPDCRGAVVLCGDLNAGPRSPACRRLRERLLDAQTAPRPGGRRPLATFYGRMPLTRIDHVMIAPGLEVVDIDVPGSELCRLASDHLPLLAELRWPPATAPGTPRD